MFTLCHMNHTDLYDRTVIEFISEGCSRLLHTEGRGSNPGPAQGWVWLARGAQMGSGWEVQSGWVQCSAAEHMSCAALLHCIEMNTISIQSNLLRTAHIFYTQSCLYGWIFTEAIGVKDHAQGFSPGCWNRNLSHCTAGAVPKSAHALLEKLKKSALLEVTTDREHATL